MWASKRHYRSQYRLFLWSLIRITHRNQPPSTFVGKTGVFFTGSWLSFNNTHPPPPMLPNPERERWKPSCWGGENVWDGGWEVRGVSWIKGPGRWAWRFFTGVNEFTVSERSVRDAAELPLGHPWCVSGYALTNTHASAQTARCVNTRTELGKQVGARTGAWPGFLLL